MHEVKLKFTIDGYAPVAVNPEAFDVPNTGVEISHEGDKWTAEIKFAKGPTCLCGNIINCENSHNVSELHLPESITVITAPLGWLDIRKPQSLSINKSLLSADGNLIIYENKVIRQVGTNPTVTIPDGITTIGESAFEGKDELTKVEFPTTVTDIERCAFKGCWCLPIKFPRNLQTIGDYAFESCARQKASKINIPAKVTTIGNFAFKDCGQVTSVKISKSVTEIGQGAFAACDRIKTFEGLGTEYGEKFLVMGKRLISVAVDSSVLENTELVIPDDIEEIGDWAITYCDRNCHWTTVKKLPSALKRIGSMALYGVRGGAPVVIPDSVEEIGEAAFSPEMRVAGRYVNEDGVVIKDSVLLFKNFTRKVSTGYGTKVEPTPEYDVPDGVTRIGDHANLRIGKLSLPEGLESIGEKAIRVSEEISLPSTLKYCSGIVCEKGCLPLSFPSGIVSVGTTFNGAQVTEISMPSNPPSFKGSGYGEALLVVPQDKFLEYKEAYEGLLSTSNFPNGRIAYRNAAGELSYELESSAEEKAVKAIEENDFWQDFESLAASNEKFANLIDKCPHGLLDGDGERYYFIDFFPEYLRIELRYNKKTRISLCTLHELQNENSIYNPIHWFRFKNETGLKSEAVVLNTGSDLKNRGIQWTMPENMDIISVYGILYSAAVIQAEDAEPKVREFLNEKAYEQKVKSGKSMYQKYSKQEELTEVTVPDTAGVTDFREMFYGCWKLSNMPLFDTSSGIGFDKTFEGCSSLTTLPLFNFSNAESFRNICLRCRKLDTIEWTDTKNVRDFNSAFSGCELLKHVVLDLSSATDTGGIFYECKKLSDVTLINLGANPDCTKLALDSLTKWAKKNVVESLVKLSFDRKAAGYLTCEIIVASKVMTVLKPEDIATIEAKGFKLTR